MKETVVYSSSQQETETLGRRIAELLRANDVIALYGGLGAGKTALTRGIARGLGIERAVTSPTYTLLHQYQGRLPLNHFDVYRLRDADDAEAIGFDEWTRNGAITVIEWPERIEELLDEECIVIHLEGSGDERRTIRIIWPDGRGMEE